MNSFVFKTIYWRLPETMLPDSLQEMAIDGQRGNEGIVLWLGRDDDNTAEITHLVKLRGPLIKKMPNQIHIESALFNEVADVAIEHNVRLVGQIHSHGRFYPLDLSWTDRLYGLQVPNYLSLVAPDYGLSSSVLSDCGVHVFKPGRGYIRLTRAEIAKQISTFSGPQLPFIEVGGRE